MIRLDTHPLSEQLVKRAAAGDQEAFACLTRRMMPLLRSQISQLIDAGTDEDDLYQEALLALLAAVRSYRSNGGASFTTYATTCVRHRLVSAIRRSAPRTQRELPFDEKTSAADDHIDPADLLQQQEDALHLQKQLRQRLTPLEYRVLLARLQGCSYQEIAADLAVGKKAVDNAVQRLRRKMSGLL